ncbi:MAG: biotin-protein ligase/biotin operon repressor [Marine Group I thaumarchaeote]|nr:MAG: biotin-protein ligase/biotin operon repressor [Marine Group I thaumarchaeote]
MIKHLYTGINWCKLVYTSVDSYTFVKVLSLLKSSHSKYLSGQKISNTLRISRVAVWKSISKIRRLGYKVQAHQKLGYKLIKSTDYLVPWEIKDGIKTKLIGKRFYYFDTIDSTQNYAVEISSNKKENGSVVIARTQSHGRGRLKRKWSSPKGGIWLSVIFHPEFEISNATLFPIVSSLALCIAIEKVLKLKPKLKWPNDVTLNNKKVAGMLVDVSVESNSIEHMILGVGINFKIDVSKLEKTLKNTGNFYGIGSLTKLGTNIKPLELVQAFLFELENAYQLLTKGNHQSLIKQWTRRSSTIGKSITVHSGRTKIAGKAIRVDYDGALVISAKGKKHRILVGDVT